MNVKQTDSQSNIDLGKLLLILWKGKIVIILGTFVAIVASIIIAISLPNEYKATALLQPVKGEGSDRLNNLANQFGGLATLAGVNFGSKDVSGDVVAIEMMKTWEFSENFIRKYNIEAEIFAARKWDGVKNILIFDDDIYDVKNNTWLGKDGEPSSWELYKEFISRLAISKNKDTGLISISITHFSPHIAKEWVDRLVNDINQISKDRALEKSSKSITYLEKQISKTSLAEIRTVFSQLIQEQHKTRMLAEVSEEFVFKTISKAKVPEESIKPKRAIIVIAGTLLGFFLFSLSILIIYFGRTLKKE